MALITCDGGIPGKVGIGISLVWTLKKSRVSMIGADSEERRRKRKEMKSKTGVTRVRSNTGTDILEAS